MLVLVIWSNLPILQIIAQWIHSITKACHVQVPLLVSVLVISSAPEDYQFASNRICDEVSSGHMDMLSWKVTWGLYHPHQPYSGGWSGSVYSGVTVQTIFGRQKQGFLKILFSNHAHLKYISTECILQMGRFNICLWWKHALDFAVSP
jgi:hypothetical protein